MSLLAHGGPRRKAHPLAEFVENGTHTLNPVTCFNLKENVSKCLRKSINFQCLIHLGKGKKKKKSLLQVKLQKHKFRNKNKNKNNQNMIIMFVKGMLQLTKRKEE